MGQNKIKKPINVLVTAIGGGGHGEQILKALLLAEEGYYRIFGADANPHCPQFQLVEKKIVLPKACDPAYIDALLEICAEHNIAAVFHGCEPELKALSKNRQLFREKGILLPINPSDVIDACMNKSYTARLLQNLGIETPKYVEISETQDLGKVDFFPVVVKPSVGGGGSANCYIAQNIKQLQALGIFLGIDSSTQKFMVQEYVGTPEDEYTVGVLLDLEGNLINSIAIRRILESQLNIRLIVKNQTDRSDLGDNLVISSGISHGYIGDFPEVTRQCEEIAKGIGARGAINIQCRFVNGKVKVFEINPRFSGTTSLRAMMGYNEPDCLLKIHLLNEKCDKHFSYRHGLILRSLCETEVKVNH